MCVRALVQTNLMPLTQRASPGLRCRATMAEIDCEYTIPSICISTKVALQSVKNDLSILSREPKRSDRHVHI